MSQTLPDTDGPRLETIRLPASQLKPSRDQRQTLNRWNRFVLGEKYLKELSVRQPKSKAEKKQDNSTFDLISAIHQSETSRLNPYLEPEHKFEVTLEADTFTEEKYALFDNYQRHVHHEGDGDVSRAGFKRFLCASPLHRHASPAGQGLGSFHQCYRLDGRLIAMGVVDLLPHAVSGVYFLYHSDFEKWSFGKLSALREAALALEQGYEYYYMGYYIHGCKKMRYKGDYKPQYVLDYHSLEWDVLDDDMRALMERKKYASVSLERQRKAAHALRQSSEGANGVAPAPTEPKEGQDEASDVLDVEDDVQYPVPLEAFQSGLSLLEIGMPGVLSLAQLKEEAVDLNQIKIHLGRGSIHKTEDIVAWHTGSEDDNSSIKGIVTEFAAAVGPEIAKNIIVDFSQSG